MLRFRKHKNSANYGSSQYIHRAFRKYGFDSFEFTVIFQSWSNDYLDYFEREFIREYDCCILDGADKGYNMTRGGEGVDSETGAIIQKARYDSGDHNWAKIDMSEYNSLRNAERVADGTHHFLGSTFQDSRVAAGLHPWAGESGSEHNSKKARKEIAEGRHNFNSEFSKEHNKKRVDDGTHNFKSQAHKDAASARSKARMKDGTHQFSSISTTKSVCCLYCKQVYAKPSFGRHHGDKCKNKP